MIQILTNRTGFFATRCVMNLGIQKRVHQGTAALTIRPLNSLYLELSGKSLDRHLSLPCSVRLRLAFLAKRKEERGRPPVVYG